jgi:hypothetical protein
MIAASEVRLNEKRPSSPASIDPSKSTSDDLVTQVRLNVISLWAILILYQIVEYIATDALPNLRRFSLDNDRVLSICNTAVYSIVAPAIKGRPR